MTDKDLKGQEVDSGDVDKEEERGYPTEDTQLNKPVLQQHLCRTAALHVDYRYLQIFDDGCQDPEEGEIDIKDLPT